MPTSADTLIPNGVDKVMVNGTNGATPAGRQTGAVPPEPIAICGIGLRLPGGIRDGDDFWKLLIDGRDARSEIPASRFNIDGFDASLAGQGAIHTRHGYFLEDDLSRLDTSFFSMSKSEMERCDPQQRLLLEVVRECLEDAGEVNYRGQPVGCYVGTFGQDWHDMTTRDVQGTGNYSMMGAVDLVLANRVSYEFDLRGPSLVVKTGCSASLVALHEACRALQSGDASAAVVGGTSLIMNPTTTALFFNEGVLSPDSSCKTFDASANGFARAEGITAIYIKRLDDALRDGNPIRAVIRNTGSNSDGRSQGVMSPSAEAHEAMMRKVYQQADMDPSETAFVECHGTGTAIGDPIETQAVGNVFGDKGVHIGSVKPNVGHSEGCSGITSLIKAVLSLEHRTIPPNIKFCNPNPKIPFAEKKLSVPLEPTPFPPGRKERVSINSFGIGGSNAHVIVDSSLQYLQTAHPATSRVNGIKAVSNPKLLLFSANSATSLDRRIESFRGYAAQHPDGDMDLAYTLAFRREKLAHRAFAVVNNGTFLETSPATRTSASAPSITMVFSGQGAQWPGMGRELILTSPAFRRDIIHMDTVLQGLQIPPGWSILDELLNPAETNGFHRAELAQPLSTALQIALVRHFERLGITPSAVVGHSSGEISAAYTAGYISLEYAMVLAYYRGYVSSHGTAARTGGMMAAVGLGTEDVSRFLHPGACVACENSPSSTTISGDDKAVQKTLAAIQRECPGVLTRALKVDMAYHSHHMAALAAEYLALVLGEDSVTPAGSKQDRGRSLFFSTVTSKPIDDASGLASPYYWAINLVSPVRFSGAVLSLLAHRNRDKSAPHMLLEVGPHAALSGPLRQICQATSQPCNYAPSQIRGKDSTTSFLSALGRLFQESVPVNWKPLFPEDSKTLPGLPTYPWDHSSGPFWHENRLSKAWRTRRFPQHCLLGIRVVETPDTAPQWRNILHLEHVPWLSDHKVRQDIVFPFAAYVAMAGEAVRQVTGCETGYRLRHVVVRAALLLTDAEPVEMVTALRPHRLTDADDSTWFEFAIASYTGSAWIKHCEGQVMPLNEASSPALEVQQNPLPRRVAGRRFYDALAQAGLVFGPGFRRLTDISSSVTDGVALAKLVRPNTEAFPGPLHPTSIDACIQLLLVASVRGVCRSLHRLEVPTMIEHIEISHGADEMQVTAHSSGGLDSASVECVAGDNRVALRMSGLQVAALDNDGNSSPQEEESTDVHAAAWLQWLPDFDFVPLSSLIKPPVRDKTEHELHETLTLLCILESADKLAGLTPCQPHFSKYRDWLHLQITKAQAGDYPLVANATEYTTLSPSHRHQHFQTTFDHLLTLPSTNHHAAARGIQRTAAHAAALFTGAQDPLDLLMQDDLLTDIYTADTFDYSAFIRLLAHARPELRILEVGAGTGGTTELLLRHLVVASEGGGGLPAYKEYMFTDVSAGFFPQARERFGHAPNMQFKALDVSRDAVQQGFGVGAYDLVVAPNVVHATACLGETLGNLRPLLKGDGMLLLVEISTVARIPGYVFGNFEGWWLGQGDGRVWEPHVAPERWDRELKAAGFMGVEGVVEDAEMPWQMCVAMVSRPRCEEVGEVLEKDVTVLCRDPDTGPAASLISGLGQDGWRVTPCKLGKGMPRPGQDIIACVDLETSFFDQDSLSEDDFSAFQDLLHHLKEKTDRILWLTRPFQVKCREPRGAQTLGVMRTIRTELGVPLFTLELDYEQEPQAAHLIAEVFTKKVRGTQDGDILNTDREFAIDRGVVLVGRYHPFSLAHDLTLPGNNTSPNHDDSETTRKTIHLPRPGHLSTLHWQSHPTPATLPPDTVEVAIHAAGLNFRDMLLATGALPPPSPEHNIQLGLEASGTITRISPSTSNPNPNLQPGTKVLLLSPTTSGSTLTTKLTVPTSLVVPLPRGMSLAAAAAAPVCYITVLHALLEVGRLRPGMSVLVHSACGGVGLAALDVCAAVGGVEVYVTVGSEEKVGFLVERLGVERKRVFGSRDGGFVEGVMRETGGRGVDVVVNSLAGELLHESWRCVARHGVMVELGKRDLLGKGRLDMGPFLANRTYAGVDMHAMMWERPGRIGELLAQYVDMYEQRRLHAPDPVSYFDAADVEKAFRHLQNGAHIGKVVVTMPDDASQIKSLPSARPLTLDPDATYLLVGGSKGLGSSIATWLAEQGAKNLTFLSRSAGISSESIALFEELRAMGCSVNALAGSVERKEDVEAAISSSEKPIKGVFQLAMVLNDAPLLDMKWSEWNGTVGPKVRGTWNLHEALAGQPLDFFWMAGSIVSVIDEPGQGNYSAGCVFLEAFCQYRRSLGLPATVLNICPVDGVGYMAENAHARRNIKAQGIYSLGEKEFLDFVQLNLLQPGVTNRNIDNTNQQDGSVATLWESPGQVVMGLRSNSALHLDDPGNRTNWRRDRRMGAYHNTRLENDGKAASSETSPLLLFLDRVAAAAESDGGAAATKLLDDESNVAFLAREITKKIHELIMKPLNDDSKVDTGLTLAQIGLDSLMAIELRRWLRQVFGIVISVLEIMGSGSLIQLGVLVASKLAEKVAKS